jgi:hypothetical protein
VEPAPTFAPRLISVRASSCLVGFRSFPAFVYSLLTLLGSPAERNFYLVRLALLLSLLIGLPLTSLSLSLSLSLSRIDLEQHGFTLFLSLILSRTYSLVLDLIKAQEDLALLKSQVSRPTRVPLLPPSFPLARPLPLPSSSTVLPSPQCARRIPPLTPPSPQ